MKVYIGFDSRQSFIEKFDKVVNAPYEVCEYSIKKHNPHIEVEPIILSELVDRGCYYRDVDPLASTEFTYSRFLVPFLNNYKGIAVFCDSDFLWNCDVEELLEFYDDTDRGVLCSTRLHTKHYDKNGRTTTNNISKKKLVEFDDV